jgi:hypothetical protein
MVTWGKEKVSAMQYVSDAALILSVMVSGRQYLGC